MQTNRLDGSPPPTSFYLFIILQFIDRNFVVGDVSSAVLCVPGSKLELILVVFSLWLLGVSSAFKKSY